MTDDYFAGGPLVWLLTMAITTLLLVASAQALWLVVPLLIAIILYYALYPAVRRLSLSGMSREAAAALAAGGLLVLGVLIMIPLLPWLAAQSVAGEQTLYRYLEGGRVLIDRLLGALESQFAFLKRLDFHAEMGRRLGEYGDTAVQKKLGETLLAAAASLPTLLLAPFFAFFFLRDGQLFTKLVTRGVPNAFFERTIYMFERVDAAARGYFQGLLKLTAVDTVVLGVGFMFVGVPNALVIGLICAVLEWIPMVGTVIGVALAVLVAATDHPNDLWPVYGVVGVFVVNRMLDNFFFIPLTVGRSIKMHPLPTVLMVFIGGAVAGIPGLILALPLAGVVGAIVGTVAGIVNDPRLRARNRHAKALLARRVTADLGP
ncbi:MAG: AI-2E family transporter [Burkholderiales bacterium]|nr:AI-2E family transporter [Burkholderiales bacterium]